MRTILVTVLAITTGFSHVNAIGPGDSCVRDDRVGTCTKIYDCGEVIRGIQENRPPPKACYTSPSDPVPFVCCLDKAGRPTPAPATSTADVTSPATPINERLATRKCREYAKLAFELMESVALISAPSVPIDKCVKSVEGLIVGGKKASLGEFPHMALLGYGNDPGNLAYDCGGSLISEQYVLTASHCFAERSPSYVLLGEHKVGDDTDLAQPQLIAIGQLISHPRYEYPSHYNDIALIRLAEKPRLGPKVRPACLHTGDPYAQGSLIASGWGRLYFGGEKSDILMKVNLDKVAADQCNKTYRGLGRTLIDGIKNDQQMCAGSLEGGKDTCQGDSGGPLQVYRSSPHCTYDIVGVVSFGKGCALPKTPGVYARVEYFLDWIENTVWPRPSSSSRFAAAAPASATRTKST